jgi:hypothetical protein
MSLAHLRSRFTRGLSFGWRSGYCMGLALAALLLGARPVNAQVTPPGGTERALPGFIRVGVPTPTAARVVAAAGIEYGRLDARQAAEAGHRLGSSAAVAFAPLPELLLAADLRGRWDRYPQAESGPENNLYGEPRFSARYSGQVARSQFLGIEGDARLIGAEAPSIKLAATSPSVRALWALRLNLPLWLGAHLGVHWDRSARAVPEPERVPATDKRTLGASSWKALQWGVGGSYRVGRWQTELLGEFAGAALIGADSPAFMRSHLALSAGVRQPLDPAFAVLIAADLALSQRPSTWQGPTLTPAEPRVALRVALIWQLDAVQRTARSPAPPPATTQEPLKKVLPPPQAQPIQRRLVVGVVVDEGGRPLPDVELTLIQEAHEPKMARSFADGRFEFEAIPEGAAELRVSTPGFDPVTLAIAPKEEGSKEIVMRPAVPAGQVRGAILDVQGRPIAAKITITGNATAESSVLSAGDEGRFELELPPGRYVVKFEHPDFATQTRRIHLQDRGVVILNIALVR